MRRFSVFSVVFLIALLTSVPLVSASITSSDFALAYMADESLVPIEQITLVFDNGTETSGEYPPTWEYAGGNFVYHNYSLADSYVAVDVHYDLNFTEMAQYGDSICGGAYLEFYFHDSTNNASAGVVNCVDYNMTLAGNYTCSSRPASGSGDGFSDDNVTAITDCHGLLEYDSNSTYWMSHEQLYSSATHAFNITSGADISGIKYWLYWVPYDTAYSTNTTCYCWGITGNVTLTFYGSTAQHSRYVMHDMIGAVIVLSLLGSLTGGGYVYSKKRR